MKYTPHGKHLIAGEWVGHERTFLSEPAYGPACSFSVGTVADVESACSGAMDAFSTYGRTSSKVRAAFLNAISDEIETRGEEITEIGCAETGLPEGRLIGERARTVGQLRMFASHILGGAHLDRRRDQELPNRKPQPRPDLRLLQRPIGPVAVFGASNFPLAFSTAGGDVAAALAAGCPVVVKGHSAHPGTAEIVATAIDAARREHDLHPGVFSLVQGGSRDVGAALVRDASISAVGFTGSLSGGRFLFDLCASRPDPIPFFGELGSINPVFLLSGAVAERAGQIGAGWAESLALGAGQFCTNPGVVFVLAGSGAENFIKAASEQLASVPAQTMLTAGIARSFHQGRERVLASAGVMPVLDQLSEGREALPVLARATAETWRTHDYLSEEVFGPLGLVVTVADEDEMVVLAEGFAGQLTAAIHMADGDLANAGRLLSVLERKAGRVLVNGFPTGVEVADAMVHGGPYPASTNFGATSVGSLSIRRFLRPVCYQNMSDALFAYIDEINEGGSES